MRGSAFLWHQIRCMVAVLFMIGQGVESVDVSHLETFMFVPVSKLNPILTWEVYIFIKCWFRDELAFTQVIDTLLDTKKTPRKPQYLLASEIPLVLRTCEFENVDFICSPGAAESLRSHFKNESLTYQLESVIYQEALRNCLPLSNNGTIHQYFLYPLL
jgi:tRNA pseudouridine38/39 synthase